MKRIRIRLLLAALLIVGGLVTPLAAESPEEQATEAAQQWLELVDQGQYAESWATAAELFRGAISKEDWVKSLAGARTPLGEVKSREVSSRQHATSLPGAPDGEYVVIQYRTVFTAKSSAVETVTPMKDPDGRWRVSGYYIR